MHTDFVNIRLKPITKIISLRSLDRKLRISHLRPLSNFKKIDNQALGALSKLQNPATPCW